jgi:hypothetical protein
MGDFFVDLQLFAEGDVPDAGQQPEVAAQGEPAPAPDSGQQPAQPEQAETQADSSQPEFGLRKSPDGVIRLVDFASDGQQSEPQQQAEVQQQAETQADLYDTEALIKAMVLGQVDEARIPDGLKGDYYAIVRQQALQQQALQQQAAIRQQQLAAQLQAQQQQQQPQDNAVQAEQIAARYKQIDQAAAQQAMQDLGLSQEDLDAAEYDENGNEKLEAYKIAKNLHLQNMLAEGRVAKERAQMSEQQHRQIMEQILPAVREYAKDPRFGEIDKEMLTFYQQLPYEQGIVVKAALDRLMAKQPTQADLPVLEAYYKATRQAVYAKSAGVSMHPQAAPKSNPPVVEQPGNAGQQPIIKGPEFWRQMRSMDARERSDFLRANLG